MLNYCRFYTRHHGIWILKHFTDKESGYISTKGPTKIPNSFEGDCKDTVAFCSF